MFTRRFLAAQGFAPTVQASLIVTAGVACAYAAIQLAYVAFLRVVKPGKGPGPLLSEAVSHGCALLLLPFLAGIEIPWPHPLLAKAAPLIFLAAFGAFHCFFKLVTLFAATQSPPSDRLGALGWMGASLVCLYAMYLSFALWSQSLESARTVPLSEASPAVAGAQHAIARRIPEGAAYRFEVSGHSGQNLTLRWAPAGEESNALKRIHVRLEIDGAAGRPQVVSLELEDHRWTEMVTPSVYLPANAQHCSVTWSAAKIPDWVVQTGLSPVSVSSREMYVSGPWFHDVRAAAKAPNIVVLAVEGIGAESVSALGYGRATTPSLDEFGLAASLFANAYTPSPEPAAACMTLLTGLNPLRHRYLGAQRGPLPEGFPTLPELLRDEGYATAAFTEGRGPDGEDLSYGSGFERGFEIFDDEFRMEAALQATSGLPSTARIPAGSMVTLNKAARWLEDHSGEKVAVFVRLRELRSPLRLPRYGEGFLGRGRTPTPKDIYDTALAGVDQQIGEFLRRIQTRPDLDNTCILIASIHGYDFTEPGRAEWRQGGQPKRTLTESCLRVPLYVLTPGEMGRQRAGPVGLEDVAPTLADFAGTAFPHALAGKSLFEASHAREPISMYGDPLVLSMRARKWRFTWQSGLTPFSDGPSPPAGTDLALIDIDRYLAAQAPTDVLSREPMLAAGFRERLRKYLHENRSVQ